MPRYFMHVQHGDSLLKDFEGEELSSLDAARDKAHVCARELMSEMVLKGRAPDGHQFLIHDEDGLVLVVPFKDAIA